MVKDNIETYPDGFPKSGEGKTYSESIAYLLKHKAHIFTEERVDELIEKDTLKLGETMNEDKFGLRHLKSALTAYHEMKRQLNKNKQECPMKYQFREGHSDFRVSDILSWEKGILKIRFECSKYEHLFELNLHERDPLLKECPICLRHDTKDEDSFVFTCEAKHEFVGDFQYVQAMTFVKATPEEKKLFPDDESHLKQHYEIIWPGCPSDGRHRIIDMRLKKQE